MQNLTIGKLSEQSGISTDTLRYYEKMKLLKAERSMAGYRLYSPDSVKVVRFIRGAKALNFTLAQIRHLLTLSVSDQTTCAQMVKHTEAKIDEAQRKIGELKQIKHVLTELVKRCPGDDTTLEACPILGHIRNGKLALLMTLFLTAFIIGDKAEAKPISYVDGIMAMQENDETGHTISLDYTFDPHYAVGWYDKWEEHERDGKDFSVHSPEFNTLIHRWNLPDGQANIFNSTGVGFADGDGKTRAAAWTSFLADYESRRWYGSYEVRGMYADTIDESLWQRGRIGIAPYKAGYDDVATWFMVQVDNHPDKTDTRVVTPLVRFFYKTSLIEAGYSSNRHLMLNWQLQF